MSEPWIEKHLSEAEVHERRLQLESELDEQDRLSAKIADHKWTIKETSTAIERVTDRVRELRKQIRERRQWLKAPGPQQNLAFADEKPAENKPDRDVSRNGYQLFDERYPLARTTGALRDELFEVLSDEQYSKLTDGTVEAWHPDSGIFDGIAQWARIERAHIDAKGASQFADGMIVPARTEMPEPLRSLLDGKPAKKKRARKAK